VEERYIAAVDLGTSKLALSIAKVYGNDVQVVWYGEEPSAGIRYGYIYNPNKVLVPFKALLDKAEKELGIHIRQAAVGLPKYYIHEMTAPMTCDRSGLNESITREDVSNLKEMAIGTYPLDDAEKEVHFGVVAQSYDVEDMHQASEEEIIGTFSSELSCNFKVFIGSRTSYNYIDRLFNEAGLSIAKRYFTAETTARLVLTQEEMENGVALIDLGAGASSVTVFSRGILRHYASIPFGGASITEDIRMECGFNTHLAENIKLKCGNCISDKLANMTEKVIKIDYHGTMPDKELPVRYLAEVIQAREEEIINAMLYEIQRSGYADELRSGVVITGGASEMLNTQNLIKDMSGYNVRMGYPLHLFSANGCAGTTETAATGCMGMIMALKNDISISCAGAAENTSVVGEKKDENERETPKNLFGEEEIKDTREVKRPSKPRNGFAWPDSKKIRKAFDNSIGSLFDGLDGE